MQGPLRRWLTGYGLAYILSLALLCVSWLTPAAQGDLTRLAGLAEHDFHARDQQAVVPVAHLVSVSLNKADVLVIGDSFSTSSNGERRTGLAWQAQLVAAGLAVATLHWDAVRPLCPDFETRLRQSGFQGHTVILQSVERNVANRLTGDANCPVARPLGDSAHVTQAVEMSVTPAIAFHAHANLLHGAATWFNTRQARRAEAPIQLTAPFANEAVRVVPLPDGCRWFSHLQCERGLFLAADVHARPLSAELVDVMRQRNSAPSPWRVVWAIVPDKSTFYGVREAESPQAPLHFANLALAGLGPDLFSALNDLRRDRRDVYLPNDSHLSPVGYQQMGNAILSWIAGR
ncbi:hypothetical protein [Sphaerotilus mobilis]|uniref:AlgX/AlgJ SGNH hydrolase-like domain-containing protein n=1 Tax=Sphaerotilus mobilis TaxID=47994 RepID=A0A4V2EV57_9BURK|nr:hypothetical protein [Sphaerotilus mobilis]RZS47543.1 hypothetical protein EV685_3753 [Sphaerotilus mobilis]